MKKRNVYGQHFLKSAIIAKNIVSAAEITKNDTVFELGTGHGILIPYLCEKAKNVISCLLYTSPSPRDRQKSRMPSSA